jgi:hypothetical protein
MFYFIISICIILLMCLSYFLGYKHCNEDYIEEDKKNNSNKNWEDKYYN